jgi:hypothetical protein
LASKKKNYVASLASVFFHPLTDSSSHVPELFSDLASENSELLASLESVFKILVHPPVLGLGRTLVCVLLVTARMQSHVLDWSVPILNWFAGIM